MSINNTLPDNVLPVITGVPQDIRNLGPLSFTVCMNSVNFSIQSSQVLIMKFADDMKSICFSNITSEKDCAAVRC